jgi:predicted AAA+ superfamily ATPase
MMLIKRREIQELQSWSERPARKPLLIRGARQVGKSTLVTQWAATSSLKLLAVNFERNPELRQAFATHDPVQIVTALQLLTNQTIRAGETLLFLDEIQAAPEAIVALRYFYEEMPRLHVIGAGSLLEFTLSDANFSMPVGRVEYMNIGPLQFEDFLGAMDERALAAWLGEVSPTQLAQAATIPAIHDKYITLLRQYWVVGGLPEVVANFAAGRSFNEVTRLHQNIVATYRDDFSKYSHGALKTRVQLVFDRLPTLVGRKFKYSNVSHDHRAAELAAALQQLCMARIAYKVQHTAANGVPLGADADQRQFKPLYMDVGLMCNALGLNLLDLQRDDLSLVNDGAVAEQFIGQHLLYSGASYETPALYCWIREARTASAEVDYVLAHGQQILPVEIKAGKSGTLKSLHIFLKEKRRRFGLRFNADLPSVLRDAPLPGEPGLRYDLLSLPLYMVGQTHRLLRDFLR